MSEIDTFESNLSERKITSDSILSEMNQTSSLNIHFNGLYNNPSNTDEETINNVRNNLFKSYRKNYKDLVTSVNLPEEEKDNILLKIFTEYPPLEYHHKIIRQKNGDYKSIDDGLLELFKSIKNPSENVIKIILQRSKLDDNNYSHTLIRNHAVDIISSWQPEKSEQFLGQLNLFDNVFNDVHYVTEYEVNPVSESDILRAESEFTKVIKNYPIDKRISYIKDLISQRDTSESSAYLQRSMNLTFLISQLISNLPDLEKGEILYFLYEKSYSDLSPAKYSTLNLLQDKMDYWSNLNLQQDEGDSPSTNYDESTRVKLVHDLVRGVIPRHIESDSLTPTPQRFEDIAQPVANLLASLEYSNIEEFFNEKENTSWLILYANKLKEIDSSTGLDAEKLLLKFKTFTLNGGQVYGNLTRMHSWLDNVKDREKRLDEILDWVYEAIDLEPIKTANIIAAEWMFHTEKNLSKLLTYPECIGKCFSIFSGMTSEKREKYKPQLLQVLQNYSVQDICKSWYKEERYKIASFMLDQKEFNIPVTKNFTAENLFALTTVRSSERIVNPGMVNSIRKYFSQEDNKKSYYDFLKELSNKDLKDSANQFVEFTRRFKGKDLMDDNGSTSLYESLTLMKINIIEILESRGENPKANRLKKYLIDSAPLNIKNIVKEIIENENSQYIENSESSKAIIDLIKIAQQEDEAKKTEARKSLFELNPFLDEKTKDSIRTLLGNNKEVAELIQQTLYGENDDVKTNAQTLLFLLVPFLSKKEKDTINLIIKDPLAPEIDFESIFESKESDIEVIDGWTQTTSKRRLYNRPRIETKKASS